MDKRAVTVLAIIVLVGFVLVAVLSLPAALDGASYAITIMIICLVLTALTVTSAVRALQHPHRR